MKKIIIIFVSSILLMSCGRPQQKRTSIPVPTTNVNVISQNLHYDQMDVYPYIQHFNQLVSLSNIQNKSYVMSEASSIIISISPLSKGVLGTCYKYEIGVKYIVLNEIYWNSSYLNFADREQLLFHELGHCVLNRDHKDQVSLTDLSDKEHKYYAPSSVMNSYQFSSDFYKANYTHYMNELFNQSTPNPEVLSFYGVDSNYSEDWFLDYQ